MVTVLRPLSTSELLDRTFHLYRNHFLLFVGITAIPQLAVLLLRLVGAAAAVSGQFIGVIVSILFAGLVSYIAIAVSHAATVMSVSDLHLDRATSIASAYTAAKGSMLRVVGISFVIGLAVGIGFLFLIAPGIYLALAWSLAIPVTVLEGGGLSVSTTRSQNLTKGSRGRIFVIYLLLAILTIVVSLIIELPLQMVAGIVGRGNPSGALAIMQLMQGLGTFLSTSLVGPLATIALTLIYYDQRVRKEGFDLQLMMATMQQGTPAVAAAVVAPNS
jgi:Membrane domain of glycerophosphoryl diester phosphodiesterase